MNCKDVSELIPAVLDGELRSDERPSIEQHLNNCRQCRNELELHSMAKRIVQQRLKRQPASAELQATIFSSLRNEGERARVVSPLSNITPFRLTWKPLIAFVAVVAVVLVVALVPSEKKEPHRHAAAGSNADIINQTFNNFDKLLAGTLLPQITSNDPFDVQQFFAQKASFKVNVPHMKRCTLKGGIFSQYNNAPVAHVLYEYDEQPIYLYQVKLQDILNENPLMLPCDIKEELLKTGVYVLHYDPNCTMVIRIVDSTVCCAVADLPKEELIAYLNEIK